MIRKAVPADIAKIITLSIDALRQDAYEELVISEEKVSALVREAASAAQHFLWVSEHEGQIDGALGALVYPMMFHERSQATVALWYCKRPGDGMRLMQQFLAWAESRPMIKQVQYCGERRGDKRIVEVLQKRYGFAADVPFLYRNR
jgi:hypothetical protein